MTLMIHCNASKRIAHMSSSRFALVATAILVHLVYEVAGNYVVEITHNGPMVRGGSITFQAELFAPDGSRPKGKFRFNWADNTLRPHTWTDETHLPKSTWNVSYQEDKFYPGEYEVQVNVDMFEYVFWMEVGSRRTSFNITNFLNGRMELVQNKTIWHDFVSNATQVEHEIILSEADKNFLLNATQVTTYWFIDCTFYGESSDLTFNYTYGTVGANHTVEALVAVSFEPITTTTTTTTTTSTTTTTTTPAPTTTTTTAASTTSSTTSPPSTTNTSINSNEMGTHQGLTPRNLSHINVPYVCLNSSIIPPDPKKTYGYFHHQIIAKAPVQNITYKGTNWLQPYNLLDLEVMCRGSGNFSTCYYKAPADYNTTGNEVCPEVATISESCHFNVSGYFSYNNYTVVIIISNDVSKVVTPVSVILYKVQKHAQLSVIVVPVVCSVVAVILIVFGVAYYVQRRKRFTVEVADFDFGHGVGDMEYKTFRERLREAVVNSLNRDFGVDGEGNVWSPSRKYGSMQ